MKVVNQLSKLIRILHKPIREGKTEIETIVVVEITTVTETDVTEMTIVTGTAVDERLTITVGIKDGRVHQLQKSGTTRVVTLVHQVVNEEVAITHLEGWKDLGLDRDRHFAQPIKKIIILTVIEIVSGIAMIITESVTSILIEETINVEIN